MKKFSIIFFVFLLTFALFLFRRNLSKQKRIFYSSDNIEIYKGEKQRILGSNLIFLDSIITKNSNRNIEYLLIYYDNDCSGCIKDGNKLIKKVDNDYLILNLKDDTNIDSLEDINILKFNVMEIKKKIKYVITPVILKIDTNFKVLDAFFPGVQNKKDFKKFLK